MIYVFTADDGEVIEEVFDMEDAPPLFAKLKRNGKVYTRFPRDVEVDVRKDRHFVAWSQEPVLHRDGTPTGSWDPETTPYDKDPNSLSYGLPVCDSFGDIENLKKQSKGGLSYGG